MAFDKDLPDELQSGRDSHAQIPADNTELFNKLCQVISQKRDEATKARKASGIEEVWTACEEAYLGIDDANRHEFTGAKWAKPLSKEGPLTRSTARGDRKSTAFVRLTSRYVDIAAAKMCEITDAVDDKAFSLEPTPVPTLDENMGNQAMLKEEGTGAQVFRPLASGEVPQQPVPDHGMIPATVGDHAKALMDKAKASAEKAETRIYDWMVESNYPAEKRKMMFDAARLGTGVIKGPYPAFRKYAKRVNGQLQRLVEIVPGLKHVSLWNLYPDPACGESVNDGDYILECDKITEAKLKALKKEKLKDGKPIYLAGQIDKVLEEGPDKCYVNDTGRVASKDKKAFTIWYFTGELSVADLKVLSVVGLEHMPDELTTMSCVVTMVNDTIIRATPNPLDSGSFGYRVMPWSRRDGFWAGVGPAEQVAMPQRGVNAATRALLNNAGLSSGLQIVLDRSQIEPSDGDWGITPNKFWDMKPGATTDDIRKIFQTFEFPNLIDPLMAVINYHFKLAEEASNIPLVTQGRDGDTTPQTFGQAEMQNTNAHTLLRAVANGLDDCITEPVVTDLYEWLLLDDNVPDEEKGDFTINAKGSIRMVEKAIQEQVLLGMFQLAANPAFGIDPDKLSDEYLLAKRLDPRKIKFSDDQKKAMASQPKPESDVVQAAKIRAQATVQASQGHDQATLQKSKLDVDRDTAYQQSLNERAQIQAGSVEKELELRRELEIYKENNSLKKELDKIKATLAEVTMKLNTQKELSHAALAADIHKHQNPSPQIMTPPSEPAGRAQNGQAFSQ